MEISAWMFWNIILTQAVMEALHRVEDKLDRVLSKT